MTFSLIRIELGACLGRQTIHIGADVVRPVTWAHLSQPILFALALDDDMGRLADGLGLARRERVLGLVWGGAMWTPISQTT